MHRKSERRTLEEVIPLAYTWERRPGLQCGTFLYCVQLNNVDKHVLAGMRYTRDDFFALDPRLPDVLDHRFSQCTSDRIRLQLATTLKYWRNPGWELPVEAIQGVGHTEPLQLNELISFHAGIDAASPPELTCLTYLLTVTDNGTTYASGKKVRVLTLNPTWLDRQYPGWFERSATADALALAATAVPGFVLQSDQMAGSPNCALSLPAKL